MALAPRHRWCIEKIVQCFAHHKEVDDPKVQGFIRKPEVLAQFNSLFSGVEESRNVVFVHYQVKEEENDENAYGRNCAIERGGNANKVKEPELFLSYGDSDVIDSKCCYFLRQGEAVDPAAANDVSLLYGEISASPLQTIETLLSSTFSTLFAASNEWGRVDAEQKSDFETEMNSFIANLNGALECLSGGLELRQPSSDRVQGYATMDTRTFGQRIQQNPEIIPYFEELLEEWCDQIDEYLNSPPESAIKKNNGHRVEGPRSELDYWRTRMQRLTSITKQLKRKDCKNVIALLSAVTKGGGSDQSRRKILLLLRRWRQTDIGITEAANEAKDNVKYLFTLQRFLEPLYSGSVCTIIDTLPALMNSIKMIYTIARYYNTPERMTNLLAKISDQMISNCKESIMKGNSVDFLWERDSDDLLVHLEACIKLNEAYQEQYRLTKRKLQQTPSGKQFEFSEIQLFGKFDLFCRRVMKLIDMFSTIKQFTILAENKLEGMNPVVDQFERIKNGFRAKDHDLLDYHNNKFDRDYVEFNGHICDLEGSVQQFINHSFENISCISHSLNLLNKFQSIIQRESLKSDLDSKLNIIFQNYGMELEQVQQLYEKQKHDPPFPRNLPPVAGNIAWSRHLLKRIEEPMKQFESNQNVLAGKDAKRIIKLYNKVARTLVAFEFLWYKAWVQSIDQAKTGLQATLIIRHPDDNKLYVNFDHEILQLIRETKCLDRMDIEIPESAKIALFQEDKFKIFDNQLHWALTEYDRIVADVVPVTAMILRSHFNDMEYKLRPGMITLTWTSMNIDSYINHIHAGLQKLDALVSNINDIIENRIEKNLKVVSKTLLVDLPELSSIAISDFVDMQQAHIATQSLLLKGKNTEVELAVDDLVTKIVSYRFESHVDKVSEEDITKLRKHYNHFMYQALLHSAKNSMNALKKRIGSRSGTNILSMSKPFFEVDVQMMPPTVTLSPSLDDIQECINRSAQAILSCYKTIIDWGYSSFPVEEQNKHTFFDRITNDIELVRVALLLTGCIQGIRNTVAEYLSSFKKYDWIWKSDKDSTYKKFVADSPSLEDYEVQLHNFGAVHTEIQQLDSVHVIGALSLHTKHIKDQLGNECIKWKMKYSDNLHSRAIAELERLTEYTRKTRGKLGRKVEDLDSLRFMMDILREVREKESAIHMEMNPIVDMYQLLESHLPPGFMEKEEIDKKTVMRSNWKKLVLQALSRTDELSKTQIGFKRRLIADVTNFKSDVIQFRQDFINNGPMVQGLAPMDAVDRLSRFREELRIRERKYDLYRGGEELFALPHQNYPDLETTRKEIKLASQLFDLYVDVIRTINDWKLMPWISVSDSMEEMKSAMESYAGRCKKLPGRLRSYDSFDQLRKEIDDFQIILPLLEELSKDSIKVRHWEEVMEICEMRFDVIGNPDFKLQSLLEADLVSKRDEIEEVTDGADKQLKIEHQLEEIHELWDSKEFLFQEWKERGVHVLKATPLVMEELEEAQMNLQTVLTMRHVTPFRKEAQELLGSLSETSDTLERWIKVQLLWCALESVFTGGDIAKQMPREAKKFSKVDKDWAKIMIKASETRNVVECCADELLRNSLPNMYGELEKCQKSLEGYLEQKQNAFPRFYFVSNAKLLIILSQGSDPLAMNEYYENVFDAIQYVEHDKKDKTIIHKLHGSGGVGHEEVTFMKPVKAIGNIEDWLMSLLKNMQATMKELARSCSTGISEVQTDISRLRPLVDSNIAQFALLAVQIMWSYETQSALELCRTKKNSMKENSQRQLQVLSEMSSWCLQDLGTKVNRKKIETLVTVHVHQRDIAQELMQLVRAKKVQDANDFEWLKQARFYWRPNSGDDVSKDGATVVSITDVDFNYQYEYLGSKERLVITPLTDKCYITLAQALGMYYGGAPAGPAGTGKTETVKDLGCTLGIFVVVTNCTDQMKYTDCAKIFKGLCQGGLWGCFDEFNRITLPVLSVVAQQVLAIQNAKKQGVEYFQFPGDPQNVFLQPVCAFFITMNPGYAGRQELPENLKALFRGVAMMTPDFQIIKKVKLCSVGYTDFDALSLKFYSLYSTCKEQLSNQRHYDWGLRNILSVLRTMGATKRENLDKPEAFLVYRTLRDMNLSKLVAQDVPLFLSLLADLFPGMSPPAKGSYPDEEKVLAKVVEKYGLVYHDPWVLKVIQLFETTRVRHGIMLVGPAGGGKSCIFKCLKETLQECHGIPYKDVRFNPKAIRAQEMYGETDPLSGEWTTGVFAALWAKYNNRNNAYNTWIIADGPVDAIWIEDLNTVLDDNKILTLANGDRIPMTDNVKIMFEVETLVNASPATVSRAGIIYVSDTELDWAPVLESWIRKRPDSNRKDVLRSLVKKWLGNCTPTDPGQCFTFLSRNTSEVMADGRVGKITSFMQLFEGLSEGAECASFGSNGEFSVDLEKLFVYCMSWSIAALLEADDRLKFDLWLREHDTNRVMPKVQEGETIYEYFLDPKTFSWKKWAPPKWEYPKGDNLDFSNLLVPTMDSTRALYVTKTIHKQKAPVLIVGAEGTAKTSVQLMFLADQDPSQMLTKRINFSSATTPGMAQYSIEAELDKRGGKNYGPPNGKKMTIFFDDVSMPEINKWGDQTTLELLRLTIEQGGFFFLDKDKRGDFKTCEDLQYLAAMQHPGGGKNDIPNRLKRNFFIFNLVLPSITSINDIYGQMLDGRFTSAEFDDKTLDSVSKLTDATIQLWRIMKAKMLPTPAKFHYIFNMRDLSRVFQGVLLTPKDSILTGGLRAKEGKLNNFSPQNMIVGLWKHECDRVFSDKLTNNKDKENYEKFITAIGQDVFGQNLYDAACGSTKYMVSFLRDDVYDEDEVLIEEAPKVYEDGGSLDMIRDRAYEFLQKYNEEYPSKKMELVLFEDALKHMLRINRLLEMPRGSALLVGVGGSGKQSLTRLASYISRAMCFQITLTKQYNVNALMDDIRVLYKNAGHKRQPTTFLFTESEIKDEVFLETINSILSTGEVPGLFAKDEMMAMMSDIRLDFLRDRPGKEETPDNLKQYFTDCVRDNLHIVLCMSPLNPKFPVRARKFPGLVSGPTVDWFLAWPEEALVSVSKGFIKDFPLDCPQETKESLMTHMGMVHKMVMEVCDEYFSSMRRQVYQTPKSYLSFIAAYKKMYATKLAALKEKEGRVKLGLDKLIQGAQDVEAMKVVLAKEQVKLEEATVNTNRMLRVLEGSSAEAKQEGEQVAGIKAKCEEDAKRISAERASCENDLAKAQPFVDEANNAINSIKPAHIGEIKKLANPSDIIKLVFDCVLILFQLPLSKVQQCKINMAKTELAWIEPSFKQALQMMSNPNFLGQLVEFGNSGKDCMNDETIEFLSAYVDIEQFNPAVAKNASSAAEGLCTYVRAMKFYHEASKIVKPKMEALNIAMAQMEAANKALTAAEERLTGCEKKLAGLQALFTAQMNKKRSIEEGATALEKKMSQASALINGLAGERKRWTEDAANFSDQKKRLVGDCAIGCAFVSYCGPFNQQFRNYLIYDKFTVDCQSRNVSVTENLDVISFLIDIGTIGDWNIQGLPTDFLSTQNGILVTKSTRFPLLIDPQGQALSWIKNKEAERLPSWNGQSLVELSDPKLKDKLEFCMSDGKSMVITGVEDEIDPMLDPVMEKQIIRKGKRMFINVSDKLMDYDDKFMMYFITRLPNPKFSPELQAKTTLIDFTVTQKGLEEQLLGKVIGKEQKALEEQLNQVLEEVNANTKSLMQLDASLLERLTSNSGDLLEDEELIQVLANTKLKAAEVNAKLVAADETKKNIAEKREQFRPAATRGSVLYFSIVEMSLVNVMYQTSLQQFLELFMSAMDKAEKASLSSKRVANIIDTMTYMTYRYINRGLYEADKLTFILLVTLKILVAAKMLRATDVTLFLRGGAALDINSVRRKPFQWMSNDVWLNIVELSQQSSFYSNLIGDMVANEAMWKRWYEDNEPEQMIIPDYEQKIIDQAEVGPFLRVLLVRCLRVDRSILASKEFLRNTKQMGHLYVEPVTDTIEMVYKAMSPEVPVIFLLSRGDDPTDSIETLCRKKKLPAPAVISLGEGQEPVALKAINAGVVNGTWVLLQNCELGLGLMNEMEALIFRLKPNMDPNFRLFITALPHPEFPLGLLQMCIKVTNEPPAGLKAGLLRSYTPGIMVDQDKIERVDTIQWRQLLFALCFLHSVVQERRKFGPLGWCIPYEYNNGDLQSCMLFLEKHLYNGPISWSTFQYMVAAVQYGGKITDSLDVRLFRTYTEEWLTEKTCEEDYTYNPSMPIFKMANDFQYRVPSFTEHSEYRKFIDTFPEIDSPEIFGLHPNADLTFRVKEATALFKTLGETQPKGGGGGEGVSREDIVYDKCSELLSRLPEDYIEDDYKAKIRKFGGMTVPMNIFLFQEIQRLQNVLAKVRFTMVQLQLAIKGEVVMTAELQETLDSIFDAKVPYYWENTLTGDEFSWRLPTLGLWFSSLINRDEQYRSWLNSGRPNSFWLTGFFNPNGCLTAMKQEVTRKHRSEKWALDDVVYHTEVTNHERVDQVKAPPAEGIFIHGLFLEGAAWSRHEGNLVESQPKTLFVPLPVLYVTGNTKKEEERSRKELFGTVGPYECPVYKYANRTDRYFIFCANLKCTSEKYPNKW
eukprot:CAMPEP_0116004988 /NCGR_PEP_ID=MMETSP0321-20121206/911_1 /TAXON_ID=163516 /ORGANISM="Leptocylindrus danicus var. danicus, Strain B650" /LENGTH=4605 /DNA_ID=CAMNT_0003473357 /DNA_START=128 /DNA_END=13942 /DNA_ORIENTATION=-